MRYTYNIIKKSAALLLVLLSLSACLNKKPLDAIGQDEAMTSLSGAEQLVTGIYTAYMSSSLYSGNLTLLGDIQADLVMAVEGNSGGLSDIYQWNFHATNAQFESIYAGLYSVIGRCNFYLDQVAGLRDKLTLDSEIKSLDMYTGEVYCARALAYAELIKCFCEAYNPDKAQQQLGVVLRLSYFNDEPITRSNLKLSYEQVIKDLDKAMEYLKEENDQFDSAYFTKAAAQAIRARVALYMKDWKTAVNYATEVIDNEAFTLSLASFNVGTNLSELDYLWQYDSGYENIWRVGYTSTSYGGALGQRFLNFTTDYYYYYPDFVPASWALNLYQSGDARYNCYFTQLQTGYPHQLVWPLLTKYYGNQTLISYQIYHVNMPKPIRLAEQYLIRAEAYCRLNEYGKAASDLTELKKARSTSGSGNVSISSDNWMETIEQERVRELYMEGFRLNDLKRWGKGFTRTPQASVQSEASKLKVDASDPRFVWPIPKHEVEAPGSQVQPNESNKY